MQIEGRNPELTSVVMVSYRTGPVLFEAIRNLLNQSVEFELLLIDNGNSDEVVATLLQIQSRDKRFRVIRGHGNIGFAAACNLGARLAKGASLLFLNPDCVVDADCLQKLKDEFADRPGKVLIGSDIRNPDLSKQGAARRRRLTPWLAFVEISRAYLCAPNHPYFRRYRQHGEALPDETVEVEAISGAFMAVRHQHYWGVGGMDEGYFLHVEDLDFCVRFHLAGGNILFCPQLKAIHVQASSDVNWFFVEWHKAMGLRRYFRAHFVAVYPKGFLSLVISFVFLRMLARSVWRCVTAVPLALARVVTTKAARTEHVVQ